MEGNGLSASNDADASATGRSQVRLSVVGGGDGGIPMGRGRAVSGEGESDGPVGELSGDSGKGTERL